MLLKIVDWNTYFHYFYSLDLVRYLDRKGMLMFHKKYKNNTKQERKINQVLL